MLRFLVGQITDCLKKVHALGSRLPLETITVSGRSVEVAAGFSKVNSVIAVETQVSLCISCNTCHMHSQTYSPAVIYILRIGGNIGAAASAIIKFGGLIIVHRLHNMLIQSTIDLVVVVPAYSSDNSWCKFLKIWCCSFRPKNLTDIMQYCVDIVRCEQHKTALKVKLKECMHAAVGIVV